MVKKRSVCKWSRFRMGSEIQSCHFVSIGLCFLNTLPPCKMMLSFCHKPFYIQKKFLILNGLVFKWLGTSMSEPVSNECFNSCDSSLLTDAKIYFEYSLMFGWDRGSIFSYSPALCKPCLVPILSIDQSKPDHLNLMF